MGRTVAASGFSPATVLAVVSKADTLDGEADDPWPAAVALTAHYGDQLQGVAAGALPVIGLLAEAAGASLVTEDVADALRRLAALPPDDRELLLLSADLFATTPDVGVGEAERVRLLDLLGLHGVRLCLGWLDQGHQGVHALTKQLHAASGMSFDANGNATHVSYSGIIQPPTTPVAMGGNQTMPASTHPQVLALQNMINQTNHDMVTNTLTGVTVDRSGSSPTYYGAGKPFDDFGDALGNERDPQPGPPGPRRGTVPARRRPP
jgi:hypothetical protein